MSKRTKNNKLISFEDAIKLKNIGFDNACVYWYNKQTKEQGCCVLKSNYNHNKSEDYLNAPSLEQVNEWLRKQHQIWVEIRINYSITKFYYVIYDLKTCEYLIESKEYDTPKNALKNGVTHAISIIEQKYLNKEII